MRALNALGLLCLVAMPGLAGAQQRGGEPADLDPNGPADPREPAEPAEAADDGLPGMGLSISGVTQREGVLSVRGADAMKAGEGSLAVFGGRLNVAGGEGREATSLRGHIQVSDGGRLLAASDFNVGGVHDPRHDGHAQRTIAVQGDLQIVNESRLIVTDTNLSVSGGSIAFSERGIGRFGNGSSAVFSGESYMAVRGGSSLQVVDGSSIQFAGSSQLIVEEGGTLTIDGDMTLSDQASFRVSGGPIVIRGAIDNDSSPDLDFPLSYIVVSGGSFTVGAHSTTRFTESELVMRNATLETNFALLLEAGSCSMRNVDLNVNDGGFVVISESTDFDARNSRLNVAGGNFEMADIAKLDAACAGDVKIASARGKGTATCTRDAINDDEAGQCAGAFFDDTNRCWKCEDTCLKSGKTMVCGQTDHL